MRRQIWIAVRLVVVITGVISGALWPIGDGGVSISSSVSGLGLWLLGPVFGLLFVVGMQAINPRSDPVWQLPAWNRNPFAFGQPLQFFHLGAFYFLGGALGQTAAAYLFRRVGAAPWAWCFLLVGVGTWLGVRLCMIVYRKKMVAV